LENLKERAIGRPRRRWVDNIKIELKEIAWESVWAGLNWLSIWASGGLL
jgi:hypothetical protein